MTDACSARSGTTAFHVVDELAMPWIRTTAGPDPAVRYETSLPRMRSRSASRSLSSGGAVGTGASSRNIGGKPSREQAAAGYGRVHGVVNRLIDSSCE